MPEETRGSNPDTRTARGRPKIGSNLRTALLAPALALTCAGPSAEVPDAGRRATPPRLAVVLVVDQMRADYLERFAHLFSGGFARILSEGTVFTDAHQDHAATVTATGHATIATGVFPARHGIVGNDFFDRAEGRSVYSASDSEAPILGHPDDAGRAPTRLLSDGVADWLDEASPESRVVSMALKDRSAVMMAGRDPEGAYWYHASTGEIVTSAFYASEYPAWVRDFAFRDRAASYFGRGWDRFLPAEAYEGVSREDRFDAESPGRRSGFPYRFEELFPEGTPERPGEDYFEGFPYTPFADEVILQLARAAVEGESLGDDDAPDLLFIGASAADYVGHRWGPYSQEVQDYYVRLDRYLGVLFEYLDGRLGRDGWGLVLTADHGVTPAPEELARRGENARRISGSEYSRAVRSALDAALEETGIDPAPTMRWLGGPHFISDTATPDELRALRRAVADHLARIDFVAAAFTADEVEAADPRDDEMISRYRRSFDRERSPDVLFTLEPNHIVGGTTATHGSPHADDTHVPLVFMGPGVSPGRHDRHVRTVAIAPTLARMLGIPAPDDLDGRPVPEIVP